MREVTFLSTQNAQFHWSLPFLWLLTKRMCILRVNGINNKAGKWKLSPCSPAWKVCAGGGSTPPFTADSHCCFSFLQCHSLNPSQIFFLKKKYQKPTAASCGAVVIHVRHSALGHLSWNLTSIGFNCTFKWVYHLAGRELVLWWIIIAKINSWLPVYRGM